MGKGELLDIADKETVISERCIVNSLKIKKLYLLVLLATCCLLLTTGCALPRIVILNDPLAPEERINLGVAYERRGKIDKAIVEYEKASKKLPVAHLYLGNAYFQKGDLLEAERHYRIAIRKVPGLSDAYNNLAWLYYIKAKDLKLKATDKDENYKDLLKKAEPLAIRAIEIDPSNKNYQNTLNKIRELESGKH